MMDFNNIKKIYFIGIGGIGMSALARHFLQEGKQVFGYDRVSTALTRQLEKEGMNILYEDSVDLIPQEVDLVIYTPAIPKDHRQFNYFLNNQYLLKKRSEILEELTRDKFTIAIGGSHGKTSVTTLIAHLLKHTGYDCTAFIGGISVNYETNYLKGKNQVVVVEADEFDRSFLRLRPDIAVITAVDSDHLDIYGSMEHINEAFKEFASKVKPKGCLVAHHNISILQNIKNKKIITYDFSDESADCRVGNIALQEGAFHFDIEGGDGLKNIVLHTGGKHNVENALAAYCVARQLGIDLQKIRYAFADFKGVKRRFEYIIRNENMVFIDDYAHHPEEINALLEAVKTMHPGRNITAVFQPHLFSRTRDLAEGFAAALDKADEVILLPVYPAREKPVEGVNSEMLVKLMNNPEAGVLSKEAMLDYFSNNEPDILLTVGAGDIDALVEPLKKILQSKFSDIY